MKLTLPLPNDDQRTLELKSKKLDYTNTKDMQRLGVPFALAKLYHIDLTEYDLEYIDKKIKAHKLYRFIIQEPRNNANRVVFYERFVKDAQCPVNVYKFLCQYISVLYQNMVLTGEYETFEQRRLLIDNWLEKCR